MFDGRQAGENLIVSGGQLNHIITHYFPLQEALTLYFRVNNSYCGVDRHLRQSRGKRRREYINETPVGTVLMRDW